jgi:hypothetical protein
MASPPPEGGTPPRAAEPLQALGPHLLGDILARLPSESLRSARLAARVFDAASRASVQRLTFVPYTISRKERNMPRLEHFPALTCLRLVGWFREDVSDENFCRYTFDQELRRLTSFLVRLVDCGANARPDADEGAGTAVARPLAAEAAALERITCLDEVEFAFNTDYRAPFMALLLRLPTLKRLRHGNSSMSGWMITPGFYGPILEALPPTLEALCAPMLLIEPRDTRTLAQLPRLTALYVGNFGGPFNYRLADPDAAAAAAEAAVLAALPLSRLTSLGLAQLPRVRLETLGMTALQELIGGVELPCEELSQVAAGLPQLRRLTAWPVGEWRATDAVFPRVRG